MIRPRFVTRAWVRRMSNVRLCGTGRSHWKTRRLFEDDVVGKIDMLVEYISLFQIVYWVKDCPNAFIVCVSQVSAWLLVAVAEPEHL
jgi:hypothetical protein